MEPLAKFLPLVEQIAKHIAKRLPDKVQLDDLLGAGALALVEASRTFKATNGASFRTYAGWRIKGAMIDELRSHTWLPRSIPRAIRSINDATWRLEQKLGREPTKLELCEATGLDVHQVLRDFHEAEMELDNEHDDQSIQLASDPADKLSDIQIIEAIIDAIDTLDDREQRIIYLMYDEGLEQQVVAKLLDLTPSRICQIRKRSLEKLRTKLAA